MMLLTEIVTALSGDVFACFTQIINEEKKVLISVEVVDIRSTFSLQSPNGVIFYEI